MNKPGNESHSAYMSDLRAPPGCTRAITGAVVAIVKVTCVSPLPLLTCVELRVQVLNGGQLAEDAKMTLPGNVPPDGATSRS